VEIKAGQFVTGRRAGCVGGGARAAEGEVGSFEVGIKA